VAGSGFVFDGEDEGYDGEEQGADKGGGQGEAVGVGMRRVRDPLQRFRD